MMKFFVITWILGGVMEVTYKFNLEYFICDVNYLSNEIPSESMLKTKVIDFRNQKEYFSNQDSTIDSLAFSIANYIGKWEIQETKMDTIIELSEPSHKILNYDCVERITKMKSTYFVNDGKELNTASSKIQLVGSIDKVFNFLPNEKYAFLLKNIYLGDRKFCFESYHEFEGKRRLKWKISKISIEESDIPFLDDLSRTLKKY